MVEIVEMKVVDMKGVNGTIVSIYWWVSQNWGCCSYRLTGVAGVVEIEGYQMAVMGVYDEFHYRCRDY